jgi:hypothetical protein
MDRPPADSVVEDTRIARYFGPVEFFRRLRRDELSILVPEIFDRPLIRRRLLLLRAFSSTIPTTSSTSCSPITGITARVISSGISWGRSWATGC